MRAQLIDSVEDSFPLGTPSCPFSYFRRPPPGVLSPSVGKLLSGIYILCGTKYCSQNFTGWNMVEARDNPGSKLELELRRGVLVLAVLSQLREFQYGYSLRQALAQRGMPIEEGTLYPLLRRLEGQGVLASEWRIEDGPPRRYYRLNDAGEAMLAELKAYWDSLVGTMGGLLQGDGK